MALDGSGDGPPRCLPSASEPVLPIGVGEDVKLVLPDRIEDRIGDLRGRHPSRHALAEGFPPCRGCRIAWLWRRKVGGAIPR